MQFELRDVANDTKPYFRQFSSTAFLKHDIYGHRKRQMSASTYQSSSIRTANISGQVFPCNL